MRALTDSIALVEHTTVRISVSKARKGTNSGHAASQSRMIDVATVDMLTDEVFDYLDVDSVEQVFVDLRDVTFIDSCGVGALIRCKNKSVKAGKTLHVVGTHDWVADTLRLGGVSDYLTQPGS